MRSASGRLAAELAHSHELAVEVQVLVNGTAVKDIAALGTVSGSVALDGTALIRGRADLELVDDGTLGLVPVSPSSLLAPYGNELHVKRGVRFSDGSTELVGLGVFRIDRASPSDAAGGLHISIGARDRSSRISDARLEQPYQVASGTNYRTAILAVLQDAWPDVPYNFTATTRTAPQLVAEEGGDRWAFAQEMAAAIGMALYFDGDGVCQLRPVTTGLTPVASIAEGEDGVLVEAAREWTREGTYNRVIATGENTGEPAPARGVATDDNPASPTYYFGPYGKVPRFYASPFITTDAQATEAAAGILARELGTTQQVSFGALVDPRLEPDDAVTITRSRAGIDETNVIEKLTIPLNADGAMSGQTRAVVS